MNDTADENHLDDLRSLTALCPPPVDAEPPTPIQREKAARAIPASHSSLIRTYGTGCFDEFLWVFADGAENRHLDISACTNETQSILRGKQAPRLREILNEYNAAPDDLVQWGVTDNGDLLTWIPIGDPDRWPTLALQAGLLDFAISPRSSTGVVLDLLAGALRIRFFPYDFPSSHPGFSTNPYA
ncbi:hypothetical protein [Streptomyces sp. 7N604]|uniref:hypothetical protein n=1 Tax=Streptomyces sp. 7N604 TaxID=3457415 RepID=UPI003FD550A1